MNSTQIILKFRRIKLGLFKQRKKKLENRHFCHFSRNEKYTVSFKVFDRISRLFKIYFSQKKFEQLFSKFPAFFFGNVCAYFKISYIQSSRIFSELRENVWEITIQKLRPSSFLIVPNWLFFFLFLNNWKL